MAATPDTGNFASSASNAFIGGTYSLNFNVTCAASDNLLIVKILSFSSTTIAFTSVQYNGVNLVHLAGSTASLTSGGPSNFQTDIYYLTSPPTGSAYALQIIWSSGQGISAGALPVSGASTTSPFGTPGTATSAANNNPAVTATGASSSGFYVGCAIDGQATMTSTGTGQTQLATYASPGGNSGLGVTFDWIPGADAGAFTWTGSGTQWGNGWAAVGVNVNPPTGSSATIAWIT